MTKESIANLLQHIFNRQKEGIEDAFKFYMYVHKKEVRPSQYAARSSTNASHNQSIAGNPRRATAVKGKGRETAIDNGQRTARLPDLPQSTTLAGEQDMDDHITREVVENDFIRLDYGRMQKMHALGFPMPAAANGPNDGPPEYLVQRSLWTQTQNHTIRPKPRLVQRMDIDPILLNEDGVAAKITTASVPTSSQAAGQRSTGVLRRSKRIVNKDADTKLHTKRKAD